MTDFFRKKIFYHAILAIFAPTLKKILIYEKKFEVRLTLYKKTTRPLKFFVCKFLKNLSKQKCPKTVEEHA